jgi:hypothetical protein
MKALALAKRVFPLLCADGLETYPGTVSRAIDAAQVETAIAFLSMLTPTRTPRIGSGTLKHHAEDWGRRHGLCGYISRGALTAAAIALGLVVRRCGPWFFKNPHVAIGVSLKDLRRINIVMPQSTADQSAPETRATQTKKRANRQ